MTFEDFCTKACGIELNQLQKKIINENDFQNGCMVIAPRQYGGTSTLISLIAIYNAIFGICTGSSTVICDCTFRELKLVTTSLNNIEKFFNHKITISTFRDYSITIESATFKRSIVYIPPNNQLFSCVWGCNKGSYLYINSESWSYRPTSNNGVKIVKDFLSNPNITLNLMQTGIPVMKSVPEYFNYNKYNIIDALTIEELFSMQKLLLNNSSYALEYLCYRTRGN